MNKPDDHSSIQNSIWDTLPQEAKCTCEPFEIIGGEKDEKGEFHWEVLHLWKQNPVECIHELIGNPAFHKHMQYVPEKVYEDEDGNVRIFNEMWTGEWWWHLQVSAASESVQEVWWLLTLKLWLRNFYLKGLQLSLSSSHLTRAIYPISVATNQHDRFNLT